VNREPETSPVSTQLRLVAVALVPVAMAGAVLVAVREAR
jgi:hypothetical protein